MNEKFKKKAVISFEKMTALLVDFMDLRFHYLNLSAYSSLLIQA
ncbi:hypothetical protein ANH9381_2201 [Aggregatibacter actinomycetemcomitans ANH9381]|nr:hypothetical protein ANH9381_2201 [Aggregatibacter actinomycetemcomitans ANH9381]